MLFSLEKMSKSPTNPLLLTMAKSSGGGNRSITGGSFQSRRQAATVMPVVVDNLGIQRSFKFDCCMNETADFTVRKFS